MLDRVSDKITATWCDKQIISIEMKEIYKYGLEVLISNIISSVVILTMGVLFFDILNTIIFLSIFIFLRSYCGGYHADTYLKCLVTMQLTYIVNMIMVTFVPINIFFIILVSITGVLLLISKSPVENINKPLNDTEKRKCKIISIIIFLILIAACICLYRFKKIDICSTIIYTLVSILILIPVGIIKHKEVNNEGHS